jgi:hypothetical protein
MVSMTFQTVNMTLQIVRMILQTGNMTLQTVRTSFLPACPFLIPTGIRQKGLKGY